LKLKEWDPFSVAIMPQRCIVGGCDSVYGKGNIKTTFHQLPFDNEKRELWISVIQDWSGLRHLRKDSRLTNAAECGKHVSADSFKAGFLSERKQLLPNAVLSIFSLVLFKCLPKFKFLQLEHIIFNSRQIRKSEFLML
jgi:hypothetical protein